MANSGGRREGNVLIVEIHIIRRRRLDELCPRCWNPSRFSYLYTIGDSKRIHEHTACTECDVDVV